MNISCYSSSSPSCLFSTVSTYWTKCTKLALNIFCQMRRFAWQAVRDVKYYFWRLFNKEAMTFQISNQPHEETLPFGDGRSLPVEVFSKYASPYLSARDLHCLLLTSKAFLDLLKKPDALDRLFSNRNTKHFKLASLVETPIAQVSDLRLFVRKGQESQLVRLLGKCSNLTSLELFFHFQILTEKMVQTIAQRCTKLKHLKLVHPQKAIDTPLIPALASICSKLTSLDLSMSERLWDRHIHTLTQGCSALRKLNLSANFDMTDASIGIIAQNCPNLTHLNLESYYRMTDTSFTHINPGLTSVYLGWNDKLTDAAMLTLVQRCSKLKALYLTDCKAITDTAVFAIAQHCPNLTMLDLSQCPLVTHVAIRTLVRSLPELKSLYLGGKEVTETLLKVMEEARPNLIKPYFWQDQMTDEGLQSIAQRCPTITNLELHYCNNVTYAGIEFLARNCSQLAKLNVIKCSKITKADLRTFSQAYPNVAINI